MDSNEYDQFIIQKYRLVIAIAVLRTKPHNLSIEEYLNQLKSKINHSDDHFDDDMTICDDDITICDDDFNIDDNDPVMEEDGDSVNILKDFDVNNVGVTEPAKNDSLINVMQILDNIEDKENEVILNNTQSTYFDGSQDDQNEFRNNCMNENSDLNIFGQFTQNIDKQNEQHTSNIITEINEIDSQQTELYTIGLTEYNTHISQSQDNFVISKNLIFNNKKTDLKLPNLPENLKDKDGNTLKESNEDFNKIDDIRKRQKIDINTSRNPSQSDKHFVSFSSDSSLNFGFLNPSANAQRLSMSSQREDKDSNTLKESNKDFNKIDDIRKRQKIDINTSRNPSQSEKHFVSYSLDSSLNFGFLNPSANAQRLSMSSQREDKNCNTLKESNKDFNKIDDTRKRQKIDINTSRNPSQSEKHFVSFSPDKSQNFGFLNPSANTQTSLTFDNLNNNNQENNEATNTNATKLRDISNSYSLGEFEYSQSQNFTMNSTFNNNLNVSQNTKYNEDTLNIDNTKDANDKTDFDKANAKIDFDNDNSSSDGIADLTDSQAEIVTFKVLEELSKVKSYLNRKERSKSDSGYKRFQRRHSGDRASQSSGLWINESAHCLMNFIITSPLVTSTNEITEEISKVLGKLIDKLHEDETYPNFLEELLETIDKLLNKVYEGRNYGESILDKEELIERIFLLSRSIHIVKYSIEKITIILEKTLEILTDTFEIEHTDKCENLCYIFHILEHLLNRHNRYQVISSQNSSQLSQDDKILKKSSLTEIWRKKWNMSKVEISEGSSEKKCVLLNCSNVLNKIIVQAMEGYGLISFAALQCFNLLQN